MKPMVIVLTGPMGCGKTTIGTLLSQRLGWLFEDGDDFHPEANVNKMKAGMALSDEDRYPWLQLLHDRIEESLSKGESLILACSALKRKYRDILGINQQQVVSVYLKGSAELLQKRVEVRTHHYMNKGLLKSQLDTLEEPEDGLMVSIADTPEKIVDTLVAALSEKYSF